MIASTNIVHHIIQNYNQVALFAKYLDIPIEDVEYCLASKINKIHNPLREDYSPSLGFMYKDKDGKLIAKDWGDDNYSGDIFDILGLLSELNSNNSIDFIRIANIIIEGNVLNKYAKATAINKLKLRDFKIIRFKAVDYNNIAKHYWNRVGVTLEHLTFRSIYFCRHIWINNMITAWYNNYNLTQLVFAYYLGKNNDNKDEVKIYIPFGKDLKFRSNTSKIFEAIHELYPAKVLIITKSRKDKVTIEANLIDNDGYTIINKLLYNKYIIDNDSDKKLLDINYCITSFNSEAYRIKPELAEYIKTNYDIVIVNCDYDKQGILNSFFHNLLYDFNSVFLGNTIFNIDDISNKDMLRYFAKIHSINPNITLFDRLLYYFIDENRDNYNEKDIFEYTTVHGIDKGRKLVNKMFNYKQFE